MAHSLQPTRPIGRSLTADVPKRDMNPIIPRLSEFSYIGQYLKFPQKFVLVHLSPREVWEVFPTPAPECESLSFAFAFASDSHLCARLVPEYELFSFAFSFVSACACAIDYHSHACRISPIISRFYTLSIPLIVTILNTFNCLLSISFTIPIF